MSTAATPPESSPGLSEPARLANILFAPARTFSDIRRNSNWWVPWLLLSILSLVFTATVNRKIGMEQVVDNYLRSQPRTAASIERLPPIPQQRVRNQIMRGFKYFSYATPLVALLALLVMGAVLMATFNFGAGAGIPLRTAVAVVSYSFLPFLLHSLIAIASVFLVNPEGFNLENPVVSNPGVLFDAGASPVVYRLASSADIFAVWVILLMGMGFAEVSKLKRTTTTLTVAIWYLVYVLGRAALSAAFS